MCIEFSCLLCTYSQHDYFDTHTCSFFLNSDCCSESYLGFSVTSLTSIYTRDHQQGNAFELIIVSTKHRSPVYMHIPWFHNFMSFSYLCELCEHNLICGVYILGGSPTNSACVPVKHWIVRLLRAVSTLFRLTTQESVSKLLSRRILRCVVYSTNKSRVPA